MRLGYFGDGPWASRALDALSTQPDRFKVLFIVPRADTRDPELRRRADALGIPFLIQENVNDPAFIESIHAFAPDLLVSMSFNQILKAPILGAAPMGFVNCHAGALPFYRGRNPLNWALINGEKSFGVTVHHVDEGIDTGDIIRQDFVIIEQTDTYATLLEKAFSQCPITLLAALSDLEAGTARRIPQSSLHPVGFYCGKRRPGDEWINWEWSSDRIANFIRALTPPGPGARFLYEEGLFCILTARRIENSPIYLSTPGEVVGRPTEGVFVKTGDTTLLLTCAAPIDPKDKIGESFVPRWRIGTRLGGAAAQEGLELRKKIHELDSQIDALRSTERRSP